jgi:hypothetical protein
MLIINFQVGHLDNSFIIASQDAAIFPEAILFIYI